MYFFDPTKISKTRDECLTAIIYIQQDATLHSLFYLETFLRVSCGTSTHHQERKLYLQHLVFVTPLLLHAAIVEELELCFSSNSSMTPAGNNLGEYYQKL
jgi:hypothetical protein